MDNKEPRLVLNRIKTPDGTILTSYHTHDYKNYTDANGEDYMVDGGLEYIRRTTGQTEPYEELSVYDNDDFEKVRESLNWGTYGKEGDQPLEYITLSSMTNSHIEAVLEHQLGSVYLREIMEKELKYRNDNNIFKFDLPKKFKNG